MSTEFAGRRQIVNRAFTIRDANGGWIGASETAERDSVLVSIQDPGKQGLVVTIRLDFDQWEALCGLKYDVDVKRAREEIANAAEAA